MTGVTQVADGAAIATLIVGFLAAAVADLRNREVSDRLWQGMGIVGLVAGAVALAPGGWLPLVLWLLVGGLTLEHMVGWDLWFGPRWEANADRVELAAYVSVGAVVSVVAVYDGVGPTTVPWAVVALFAVVVFARILFELGVLYGGADAKALMIAGLLVPVLPVPLLYAAPGATTIDLLPFPIALLTNAALFSMVVPVALAVRNLRAGEFSFPQGLMTYSLAVRELPRRFVWVKDPAVAGEARDDAETSAEDTRHRVAVARDLEARGIERVRVTPQVPFLAVMAAGAVTAVLAGNLLLDLMLRL